MLVSEWMVIQCVRYPGIRIGLGRKEKTRLKQTSVVTLLSEAHPALGVGIDDFTYNSVDGYIKYKNGSQIILFDLAYQPSDPQYQTLGSLNLTHVVIEEAGEVDHKAYATFASRRNRFLNKDYGLIGKVVSTCNPSENFLRTEFYDVYSAQGGGKSQTWEHGYAVIDGKKQPAKRAFVHSLVVDNPFIDANYRLQLDQMPPVEQKRLRDGDWDYANTDTSVFPPWLLQRMMTDEYDPEQEGYIGADISDEGDDLNVFSYIVGDVLVDQKEINVPKGVEAATSHLIGKQLIEYAQTRNVIPDHVAVDGVGVGAGVISYCRDKGFYVQRYIGGSGVQKPDNKDKTEAAKDNLAYKNLRAASYWDLRSRVERGEAKVLSGLTTKDQLLKQLRPIEYKIDNDKQLSLEPKDKLKQKLGGKSPDHADSWNMANWCQHQPKDHRHNKARIGL